MKPRERVVVDTNALIGRLLLPASVPAQAVRRVVAEDQLLASDATIMELADVLARPKFDRYVTIAERQEFLRLFGRIAERIPIVHLVRASESATGMPPDASSTSRRHAACQVPRPHRRTTDRPGRSGPRPRQGDAYNDAWDCLPFGDA